MGFGVRGFGLGFEVSCLGFSGFRFQVSGYGFYVSAFRVSGLDFFGVWVSKT